MLIVLTPGTKIKAVMYTGEENEESKALHYMFKNAEKTNEPIPLDNTKGLLQQKVKKSTLIVYEGRIVTEAEWAFDHFNKAYQNSMSAIIEMLPGVQSRIRVHSVNMETTYDYYSNCLVYTVTVKGVIL